ncbi:MAG: lipid kinase [Cyanobacteria bacterium CRU_2_1]|nr:lipid kinase [Cyanobacteria bacterium CRU_2_1]
MTQRALLLVNPNARKGEATRSQVKQELQELGFELIEDPVDAPEHFPALIQKYQDQVDMVIVGGGDGSVNAAIAGLLDTQLPLGVIPLGTANNLARSLGVPSSLPEACRVIAEGHIQKIDLGWVNGQYFFNVAGIGLSTNINRQVAKGLKRRWGVIAYAVTAIKLVLTHKHFQAEIRCQGKTIQAETFQITVCNGRYYGSGLTVAADAAIDDRRLDLCSLEVKTWWEAIPLLPSFIEGEFTDDQRVRTLHAQELEIHTNPPQAIDTDGEITTQTPATFRVIPEAISVFAPKERDEG